MTYREHWTDVAAFQRATLGGQHRPGTTLAVDGIDGPNTRDAASALPFLSPHFTADELANKGRGGPLAHVDRGLLFAAEVTRAATGGTPLLVVSGYRTPEHNRDVGGATRSQHVQGRAIDLRVGYITAAAAIGLGVWSGVGRKRWNGQVWATHLDVRHLDPDETATPANPDVWTY